MTDEELIRAVRCCTSRPDCDTCAEECVFYEGADIEVCVPQMGQAVADRLLTLSSGSGSGIETALEAAAKNVALACSTFVSATSEAVLLALGEVENENP